MPVAPISKVLCQPLRRWWSARDDPHREADPLPPILRRRAFERWDVHRREGRTVSAQSIPVGDGDAAKGAAVLRAEQINSSGRDTEGDSFD